MTATLEAINRMQREGVIGRYAIGGAVGATFYLEPFATLDIDIFISFGAARKGTLVSLAPIYEYALKNGFQPEDEHIIIAGWKVQFLPADDALYEEALTESVPTKAGDTDTWVVTAEHLIAIALKTGRGKDHFRIDQFIDADAFDENDLMPILNRHGLVDKWTEHKRKRNEQKKQTDGQI